VRPATRGDGGAYVIAEAGVNHNGDADRALVLVEAAAAAGADAVKFQTFRADALASAAAPKAPYQEAAGAAGESQLAMLRRLELPRAAHRALQAACAERGITFLSTPFDTDSLDFLTDDLGLPLIKLGSGEVTNGPLLLAAARSGAALILSTGMSTLQEVEAALGVLAFGYTGGAAPSRAAFAEAFACAAGRRALADKVTLLHCTSAYPAPAADANLRAMDTLRDAFGLPVGLSDHSAGIAVAVAAVARGARVIEKHFTLDRTLPGPDHRASLEPGELGALIAALRTAGEALGDGVKAPAPSEAANAHVVRRSLVALRPVRAGEPFTEDNLGVKRPGGGVPAMEYWDWLGRPADRDYAADEVIGQ